MSTLQHTSELRGRTTRHLVLIVVIATIVLGGIVASIVASNGASSSPSLDSSSVVHAQPVYVSGAVEQRLAPLRAAQAAEGRQRQSVARRSHGPNVMPAPEVSVMAPPKQAQVDRQTPGQRP